MSGQVYIGTSGWQYKHWRGNFYPKDLPQKNWLKFYSQHFSTVEVNSSFYRQTKLETFEKWKSEVPPDFTFSIKGNRFITHIKRLKDCEEAVNLFFENASSLLKTLPSEESTSDTSEVSTTDHKSLSEPKALKSRRPVTNHVILWQLPPTLKKDIKRLRDFLELLTRVSKPAKVQPRLTWRHAFEFRHESWVDRETFTTVLRSAVVSTVVFQDWKDWPRTSDYMDLIGLRPEELLPSREASTLASKGQVYGAGGLEELPFIYVRFHGREQLYTSGYSDEELAQWAQKMQKWMDTGTDVYAYFNNDALGYAVENAITLKKLII